MTKPSAARVKRHRQAATAAGSVRIDLTLGREAAAALSALTANGATVRQAVSDALIAKHNTSAV